MEWIVIYTYNRETVAVTLDSKKEAIDVIKNILSEVDVDVNLESIEVFEAKRQKVVIGIEGLENGN